MVHRQKQHSQSNGHAAVFPPFPTFSSSVLYTGSPSSSTLNGKCRQAVDTVQADDMPYLSLVRRVTGSRLPPAFGQALSKDVILAALVCTVRLLLLDRCCSLHCETKGCS